MNKKAYPPALLICATLALSACFRDQPTSYYLLKPQEANPVLTAATNLENMTVLLRPVKIPEYLERPQMAVRETDVRLFSVNTTAGPSRWRTISPRFFCKT